MLSTLFLFLIIFECYQINGDTVKVLFTEKPTTEEI